MNNSRKISNLKTFMFLAVLGVAISPAYAEVTLEKQIKITDEGLHFNGNQLNAGNVGSPDATTERYDYYFGPNISAHGDAIKAFKHYVFMTWYRGGKYDRHVMLSRYNQVTGVTKTIEFPHQHTGFRGDPLVGESHNTIAVEISPVDGTIHMLYDMHAYDDNNHDGKFKDDFFRYSYSVAGAAEVADDDFTLDKFVKDTSSVSQGPDDYKHLTMTGDLADKSNFARLTYPKFFTNTDGTILLYMRLGGNNNGAYVFNRYDAANKKWSKFTQFNLKDQKSKGNDYNWGLYGNMKYVNGKLRVGFQQRSSDNDDRYLYQNGVYYAYSDHPEGNGDWKNHQGKSMTFPLLDSDEIKVFEPGDYIPHTEANSVYIVSGFDWTVTEKGDIHMISQVRSTDRNRADYKEVNLHSYKPAGADDFIITTDFSGASEIYTAGENIYIIGLNSAGYPYVEKAVGGTNDFTRIYEATDGIKFDHGAIYIDNGKLYYYLMERSSGTKQPLYLQIIDLDVNDPVPVPTPNPTVSFAQAALTVTEGYDDLSLTVNAASPSDERTIVGVKLYYQDSFVSEDKLAPYTWSQLNTSQLSGLQAGTYQLKAIAEDDKGMTAEATMQLTVEAKPEAPTPDVDPDDNTNSNSNTNGNTNSNTNASGGGGSFSAWFILVAFIIFTVKYGSRGFAKSA